MTNNENDLFVRENLWADIENKSSAYVHVLMIATKPDIIKVAPLYIELKKRKELTILVHTGQHYDFNLSSGVLEEFGMKVDVNLNIFGPIHKKYSLIIERLGEILMKISELGKIPIPYVHGDTLTAASADKAAFLNKFAVVHVESGIRTFTPKKDFYVELFEEYKNGMFNWNDFYSELQDFTIYERGSIEPFPEQFCTRSIAASSGIYATPVNLYKETLIKEGFFGDRIRVVGNTVVEAVRLSQEKAKTSKIFETFPNMKGKPFIFVTIHRRENCEDKQRFLVLYYTLKKLVQDGVAVCFLGLNASESAIDRYGLREDLNELMAKYQDNLAYGPAIAHHSDVIKMISEAGAVVMDSGSMQEEANIVGVPCVTLRFGSDRTETLLEGCNILCPPINSNLCAEIIKGAIDNPKMRKASIYGENVSEKIIDNVLDVLRKNGKLFRLDHERLGLEKYINFKI